jgi:hypothetical protein
MKLPHALTCLALYTAAGLAVASCSSGAEKTKDDPVASQGEALTKRSRGFDALTRNYDDHRTGTNLQERTLDTSNVDKRHFGKLFELVVDDQVFAGVLHVSGLRMHRSHDGDDDDDETFSRGGRRHDVIYVATMNNSVYAFDADEAGSPLWQVNFNEGFRPVVHTEVGQACGTAADGTSFYRDLSGNIGISGTPVIDAASKTMFFVTRTVEHGEFFQRLRALDIRTGEERAPARIISGIDPQTNHQHPALALANGRIYVAWASHCDTQPYHGRVLAFRQHDLSQVAAFDAVPTGSMAGIWMSGAAPVVDRHGNLYYATGNGAFDGMQNFAESIVKLNPSLGLVDYFTPSNFATLNERDLDLGSSGPIVVPGTSKVVMGGKGGGNCYLVDMNGMGGLVTGDRQIPQKWQCADVDNVRLTSTHHLHNAMVAYESHAGLNLYTWAENDFGRAWRFNGSTFDTPAISVSNVLPPMGMPGGMMTLSADGTRRGTALLWASMPSAGDANQNVVHGVLRAFDADDLTRELWNSNLLPEDDAMEFSKGSIPVVANGKVILGSLSNVVSVYGLRPERHPRTNDLALNKPVTAGGSCSPTETPDHAVNGSVSLGNSDKYCSFDMPSFLQVDLGEAMIVDRIIVRHAGAGGEGSDLDTRDFTLSTSADGLAFSPVATVTGNVEDVTVHDFAAVQARFVRLDVTTPTQNGDIATRIYELEVYGPRGGCEPETNAAFCLRNAKNCGRVTASDNCGTSRSVTSCGTCALPETCGGDGRPNVCGDPLNLDRTEGGTPIGTGQACSNAENVTMAFDNQKTPDHFSKWCVFGVPSAAAPISVLYDFSGTTSFVVNRYAITTGNDAEDRAPRDWTFEGCHGACTVDRDEGWVVLDSQSGQFVGAPVFQTNSYAVANTTAFEQYRLRVTANNGSPDVFQMTELQMFGLPGPAAGPELTQGGLATATGTECSDIEDVSKAYDNRQSLTAFSKWCVLGAPSEAAPISTEYDFAGTTAHAVTRYTITTGNDVPERDPRDWTFQGCQGTCIVESDAGWVTLDTQAAQFDGAGRFQTNAYSIANTTPFQQYRLRVTANHGDPFTFQLSEIQLF